MTALDWTILGITSVLFFCVIAGLRSSRYENRVGDINTNLPAKVSVAARREQRRSDAKQTNKKPVDIAPLQGQIVNVRWAINE